MNSIYHFFQDLLEKRKLFQEVSELGKFPYPEKLLSCRNKGKFPDMAIKINDGKLFTGGELIELKDSGSYTVSSFNSTIPTGKKDIMKIIGDRDSSIRRQMEKSGDKIENLPVREVYYLVRGRRRDAQKIALVHGSFFETIQTEDLIRRYFSQVMEESIDNSDLEISEENRIFCPPFSPNRTVSAKSEPLTKRRLSYGLEL